MEIALRNPLETQSEGLSTNGTSSLGPRFRNSDVTTNLSVDFLGYVMLLQALLQHLRSH